MANTNAMHDTSTILSQLYSKRERGLVFYCPAQHTDVAALLQTVHNTKLQHAMMCEARDDGCQLTDDKQQRSGPEKMGLTQLTDDRQQRSGPEKMVLTRVSATDTRQSHSWRRALRARSTPQGFTAPHSPSSEMGIPVVDRVCSIVTTKTTRV